MDTVRVHHIEQDATSGTDLGRLDVNLVAIVIQCTGKSHKWIVILLALIVIVVSALDSDEA